MKFIIHYLIINSAVTGRFPWTDDATFMLLKLYKRYENELGPNIIYNQLYLKVEREMKKNYPDIDSAKCQIKIDTLKREFRKHQERDQETDDRIPWKFYEVINFSLPSLKATCINTSNFFYYS